MTEQVDLDALIAEARGFAAGSESARATLMRDLADALEQSQAELQQERERARDAEERMRLLDQANDEEIDRTDKAEAALSRAEETIEAVEDFVTRHYLDTQMGERVLAILTEHGKQKEGLMTDHNREEREALIQDVAKQISDASWRGFPDGKEFSRVYAEIALAAFEQAHAPTSTEEPEWEYGNEMLMNNHTQIHPASSEFMAKAQAWLWPMHRRRKAGPWEAVPAAENNEREEQG